MVEWATSSCAHARPCQCGACTTSQVRKQFFPQAGAAEIPPGTVAHRTSTVIRGGKSTAVTRAAWDFDKGTQVYTKSVSIIFFLCSYFFTFTTARWILSLTRERKSFITFL